MQLVKTEVEPTSSVHPFRAADLSIHYKLHATLAVVRPQNSRRADNAACSRPQRRAVPALVPGLSAAFGECACAAAPSNVCARRTSVGQERTYGKGRRHGLLRTGIRAGRQCRLPSCGWETIY